VKRRFFKIELCCSIGVLFVGATIFVLGAGFGYKYYKDARLAVVGGCANYDSINDELAAGLDKMAEWYPESSADIHNNKQDIIHYIATMTNPPSNSPLRTITLSHGRRLANRTRSLRRKSPSVTTTPQLMASSETQMHPSWNDREDDAQQSSSPNVEIAPFWNDRDDDEDEDDVDDSGRLVGFPRSADCRAAVSALIYNILEFVTSFAWFTIPGKYRFRVRLLDWLRRNYDQRQLDALVELATTFVLAQSAKEKSMVLFQVLRQAWSVGNGWLKFLFDWLMDQSRTPWRAIKKCTKLAAQFSVWFRRGTAAFVGQATFQMMSAPKLIDSAKTAKQLCNETRVIV